MVIKLACSSQPDLSKAACLLCDLFSFGVDVATLKEIHFFVTSMREGCQVVCCLTWTGRLSVLL